MSVPEADGDPGAAVPGRLRWRCRRGTRELDLLLGGYLDARYPHASRAEREAFERLTEWPDPEIVTALLGQGPAVDEETAQILGFLRSLPRS